MIMIGLIIQRLVVKLMVKIREVLMKVLKLISLKLTIISLNKDLEIIEFGPSGVPEGWEVIYKDSTTN